MEFLEGFPSGFGPGVFVQGVELVVSAHQQEPQSEHFWAEDGFGALGISALGVAAHRGRPGAEPSDHVEPVEHMTGMGQTGVDSGFVGFGAVGDGDFGAPAVGLRRQKPC
ncbi:MAG: hypothetical protein OXF75_09200 [Acidimicrobiaceae bacterium]|nr:hypothetical protein [Acidimicrobiaceae bacterium]